VPRPEDDLGARNIAELGLSPEVEAALRDVIAALGEDYRDAFVAMVQAINRQASALDRIQATLNILVSKVAPELNDQVPAAVSVAPEGTRPDLASALVVPDPIGAGYVLSQEALAKAVGVSGADVSVLVRAFKLRDDGKCAVVVRKGGHQTMVNFHPRAIARFRELVLAPVHHPGLDRNQRSALQRAKAALAASNPTQQT
jgi:hypothetical protein